jgi:hypothetical protein
MISLKMPDSDSIEKLFSIFGSDVEIYHKEHNDILRTRYMLLNFDKDLLDIGSDENWTSYGFDKFRVKDLKEMTKIFDIDYEKMLNRASLIKEIKKLQDKKIKYDKNSGIEVNRYSLEYQNIERLAYTFYSEDKKLTFTASEFYIDDSGGCYFHYFGCSAEFSKALKTFLYLYEDSAGCCWNGRDYI